MAEDKGEVKSVAADESAEGNSYTDIDLAEGRKRSQGCNETSESCRNSLDLPQPVKPSEVRRVSFGPVRPLTKPPPPPLKETSLEDSLGSSNALNGQQAGADEPTTKPKRNGSIRHTVAILALSSIVMANMNRQAFNQALVSMTRPQNQLKSESSTVDVSVSKPGSFIVSPCGEPDCSEVKIEDQDELDDRFDWTVSQISLLQAAFSYGYTPFMIPGGRMSELYGAKWIIFMSGFGSALCCILSPLLADTNYYLLVGSRVMMGFCQTAVSPALFALLTRWLPPTEASVYLPMIKVGVMIGFMAGSMVSGYLPWRLTFYSVGTVGLLWSVLWSVLISSDPTEHKLITKNELDYIHYQIRGANKNRKVSANTARKASAPWFKILTNPVVLSFVLAKFTVKLSTDAQTMQIPMYMKNVFHVSKSLNGNLNAMNFAIQALFTGLVAWMAKEFVIKEKFGLHKTGIRRLFQAICNFGMGFSYILITFNMSSLGVACAAIVILSVAAMFGSGGEAVLPIDLSQDYSASIMAIANSLANFSGIILPQIVALVLDGQLENSDRWNIIWRIVGSIMIVGGLAFTFGVKAKLQNFSSTSNEEEETKGDIEELELGKIADSKER